MAPVLGIVLDPASLTAIARPLHVVWGDDDAIAMPALGAHIFRQNVPGATGASLGPVGHYAFVSDAAIHGIAAERAHAFFARALR